MIMDNRELENLIRQGQAFAVQFEETLKGDAPETMRETICAFANDLPNSGRAGVLFVGVGDDGQPSGLEITDELVLRLAEMKSDGQIVPSPSMLVERRRLLGHDVAVVIVTPSAYPPVRYRGAIHVRCGPKSSIATAQDEQILNKGSRSWNAPFDVQPVPDADITALDRHRFEENCLPGAFGRAAMETSYGNLNRRLAAAKMTVSAEDATPTVVGILALGRQPRDHLPNAWMQFLRIDGTELRDDLVDAEEIDGDLVTMLRRIDARLSAHIRRSIDPTTPNTELRVHSYPLVALQQVVRNAIMHRTYEGTNAPVRVMWFNDRIEIVSPGEPFGTVTWDNFGQPGITDYRNPNLAEVLKVFGFVRRSGVGIAVARRALREGGHPDLEFRTDDGSVTAVIRGRPE